MKQSLVILAITLFLSTNLVAQRSVPDLIETNQGSLAIQPILHGTVVFTWNNKVIYSDPYGGSKAFEGIVPPDLVLISDIHGDHMSLETLQILDLTKAILVVPQAVADKLPDNLKTKIVIVANGTTTTQLGISIEAIPMYNLPEAVDSRHTKGRGNGYVLTMGGKRIYLSGDTDDIVEMRTLKNIDVAFVCMNQPFTMNIHEASSAVLEFKPTIMYPFHYRGQAGLSDVEEFQKIVKDSNPAIEVRLRNWYPTY